MDRRASLSAPRSSLPQRTGIEPARASHTSASPWPAVPSRLSAIRSASQPASLSDLALHTPVHESSNAEAFVRNGELVTSPEVIVLADEEAEPPAKRAKTTGASFRPERDAAELQETDAAHIVLPGSPLPGMPPIPSLASTVAAHRRKRPGVEPAARKSSAALDPPAIATRVPSPKKAAEFFPWAGTHTEDLLNETVIKAGFCDKSQGANQAECNSAKATASASLGQKNSHGLSLLGYLLTAVLEKRQTIGKCTAASTFKPPPRVTVTDTKREAWLRDLANPEVPLRKQSRTIPHGIRGKLLMEQCLLKAVPLPRTVWLARCVGANELRAFRRKGISGSAAASGEAKWIREWTSHVEQFFEDVIGTCGQEGWQRKMQYAVKLAAAFYSEKLLDKDHFLDWIVSSLARATLDHLPIWIVLAQLYWNDILIYGRRGRRLAEGLLQHLHHVVEENKSAVSALRGRLEELVVILASSNQGCLILPRTWERYMHLITNSLASLPQSSLDNIVKRNQSLTQPLSERAASAASPTLALFTVLDSTTLDLDITKLTSECLKLLPDIPQLLRALLDWASTAYRVGSSRIYLSARIIAHLQQDGYDTDSAVLRYLQTASPASTLSIEYIHRVISELVHLQAFSAGKYMQWLITSGAVNAGANTAFATSLIAALPTTDLPLHVLNTRKTLLRRLGHTPEQSDAVNTVFGRLYDSDRMATLLSEHVGSNLQNLTLSERHSLCLRVCNQLSTKTTEEGIQLDDFCLARSIIEQVGDIRSLAKVVSLAATTDNTALLATVCDTVHLHAETFSALGDLDQLLDELSKRYIALRSFQPLDRSLILSLLSLAERLPNRAPLAKLLQDDLVVCEQHSSFAVCSPASDSVIGMHASTLDSDDDLDAVFASGNTMDEQLMQRVFARTMQRAAKSQAEELVASRRVAGWLNQLRALDSSGVLEGLAVDYVRNCSSSNVENGSWLVATVHLVNSGALTLATLANIAQDLTSPDTACQMLPLFLSRRAANIGLLDVDCYRYCLQQKRCQVEHPEKLLRVVQVACGCSAFVAGDPELRAFTVQVATHQPYTVESLSANEGCPDTARKNFGRVLLNALMHGSRSGSGPEDMDVRSIVDLASPLSLHFCTAAMTHSKSLPSWNEADESLSTDALLEAFNNRLEVWPQLLDCAGEAVKTSLRDWARDQVLLAAASENFSDPEDALAHAEHCLELLAVSSRSLPNHDDAGTLGVITEKLKDMESSLFASSETNPPSHSQDENTGLLRPFRILLDLLTTMSAQLWLDASDASHSHKVSLLTVLCSLIALPRLQAQPDLLERVFDLASTLADTLSEASLTTIWQHCSGAVRSDRRVQSIMGRSSDAADTWLLLASHVPSFASQQQRLLTRNVPQQQASGGRVPAPGQAQHQRLLSQGGAPVSRHDSRMPTDVKTMPFALRQWEIISDSAPTMGDNDAALSLRMFRARKI